MYVLWYSIPYACVSTIIYQQFFLAHLLHTSIDLLFRGLRVIWFDDSFNLWKSFVGIHQYKKRPFCQLSQSTRTCPKDAPLMLPTIGKAFRQLRPLANKGLPLYLYHHMKQCAGFLVYSKQIHVFFCQTTASVIRAVRINCAVKTASITCEVDVIQHIKSCKCIAPKLIECACHPCNSWVWLYTSLYAVFLCKGILQARIRHPSFTSQKSVSIIFTLYNKT